MTELEAWDQASDVIERARNRIRATLPPAEPLYLKCEDELGDYLERMNWFIAERAPQSRDDR